LVGKRAFELIVRASDIVVRAQVITEQELIRPEFASDVREMHMILPGLAAPKEVATNNALLAPIAVARRSDRRDDSVSRSVCVTSGQNVEHRLRTQTHYGGAADVFEDERDSGVGGCRRKTLEFRCI